MHFISRLYHEKRCVTLWRHYDVNLGKKMETSWQEKNGNLFSWTAYMFPIENEYQSLLPRNAHWIYNVAYTNVFKNIQRNWGSNTAHLWQLRQSRSVEAKLHILENDGRPEKSGSGTSAIWQSWKSGSGASRLWQLKQSVSGEAELQVFGSQGRAEVRKRNFTSLEVQAKMKCGSGPSHL